MTPLIASALPFLVPLYSAPKRYYHNLDHINFCLGRLTWAAPQEEFKFMSAHEYHALELAIWFHDAIYNPHAQQVEPGYSERESVCLLESYVFTVKNNVGKAEWNDFTQIIHLAKPLIKATAEHQSFHNIYGSLTTKLMLDIDLAGLGLPWDAFWHNTQNVRKEYEMSGHPTEVNRIAQGNAQFLRKLLDRPRIFYTETFYGEYERQARQNLAKVVGLS